MIRLTFVISVVMLIGGGWACSTTGAMEHERQEQERAGDTASFADRAAGYDVAYRIGTAFVDGEQTLEVEVHFQGLERSNTELYLPSRWANVDDYHEGITRLEVVGDEAELVETDFVNVVEVQHEPGQRVVLRYMVRQIFSEGLYAHRFRPHIDEDHFFFIGHGLFVIPDFDRRAKRPVLLQWNVADEDRVLANSHGRFTARQSLHTNLDSLLHALYIGGDYHFISDAESGVDFAFYGDDWSFDISEFVDKAKRIVEAGRQLFADPGAERLLVVVYAGDERGYKMGTALHDAVTLRLKLAEDFDWTSLLELVAHEVVHQWNGMALKREEPKKQYFWFSEGFTDFYTARLLLQAGLIDLEQYADFFNRMRIEYAASPAKGSTNDEVVEGFWRDGDIQRIPYLRGALFALYLDAEIRLHSQGQTSLDDVMTHKIEAARSDGTRFSKGLLVDTVEPMHPQIAEQLQSMIIDGEPITLHPQALGDCATTESAADTPQVELYTVDRQRLETDEQSCMEWFGL